MTIGWPELRDQLNLTLKPIDTWPGKPTPAWQRERGPYSAGIKDTLMTLRKELNALRARSIVLQIAIKPHQLRLDGLPRAGATAEHPGVILAFDSMRGPLRIWFDRFLKWENNLRAIAHHLEHLRMAGLYGVGEDGQHYRGWTALPAANPTEDDITMSARIVSRHSQTGVQAIHNDEAAFREAARSAQSRTHPDAGGDPETFRQVQAAINALRKHHGV